MPIRPLVLLLLAALVAAAETGGPWRTDFDAALAEAATIGKTRPLAVLVVGPNCSWCHRLLAESAESAQVKRACNDVVATVLDQAERPELAAMLGIESFPTLILVNRAGKEVRRIKGYLPSADLATVLRVLALDGDAQKGESNILTERIDPEALVKTPEGVSQLIGSLGEGSPTLRAAIRRVLSSHPETHPGIWPKLAHASLTVRADATAILAGDDGDTHGYDPFAPAKERGPAADRWQAAMKAAP